MVLTTAMAIIPVILTLKPGDAGTISLSAIAERFTCAFLVGLVMAYSPILGAHNEGVRAERRVHQAVFPSPGG